MPNNMTIGKSKAGTTITVVGETESRRKSALQYFIKVYNNDFSIQEQKKNGNLTYELTTTKNIHRNVFASASMEYLTKREMKKYNTNRNKLLSLKFTDRSSNNEYTIVHELVHVRKYASERYIKHNEQKIDFESVGRVSRKGLDMAIDPKTPFIGAYFNNDPNSTYKSHWGNKGLVKANISNDLKLKVATKGILYDRKLLTGSLDKNIKGMTATTRAKKLFPKSYFNMRVNLINSDREKIEFVDSKNRKLK